MERYTSGEKRQTAFRLDAGLLARVDAVRGGESRTAVVERLLGEWVGQGDGAPPARPVTSVGGSSVAPSSRPPAEPIPVVHESGQRMRVTVDPPARPWRQHLPTCSCMVCKPPKGTGS